MAELLPFAQLPPIYLGIQVLEKQNCTPVYQLSFTSRGLLTLISTESDFCLLSPF